MAEVVVPARDWPIKIGSYPIGGLDTLMWTESETKADTTVREDLGNANHFIAERGRTITLDGKYVQDPSTGARDDGQEDVERLAKLVGVASVEAFTLTDPAGQDYTFNASATVTSRGGDKNAPTEWKCTLTIAGAMTGPS